MLVREDLAPTILWEENKIHLCVDLFTAGISAVPSLTLPSCYDLGKAVVLPTPCLGKQASKSHLVSMESTQKERNGLQRP